MSVTYTGGTITSPTVATNILTMSGASLKSGTIQIDSPSPIERIAKAVGIISEARKAIDVVEQAAFSATEAFNEGIRAAIAQYIAGEEWEISEDFVVSLESLLIPVRSQPTD